MSWLVALPPPSFEEANSRLLVCKSKIEKKPTLALPANQILHNGEATRSATLEFCTYETFIGNLDTYGEDMNINHEIKIFAIFCLSMVE